MYGWTLAESAVADYWSIDLMSVYSQSYPAKYRADHDSHRLFHVPQVTNSVVAHFAEDLSEVLELAETNSSYAIYDQDALQYFAARKFRLS